MRPSPSLSEEDEGGGGVGDRDLRGVEGFLLLVILTMLGLKRRSRKTEIYRPVHSCPGESDLLYTQPRNISYIDLYGHCSTAEVSHDGDLT